MGLGGGGEHMLPPALQLATVTSFCKWLPPPPALPLPVSAGGPHSLLDADAVSGVCGWSPLAA